MSLSSRLNEGERVCRDTARGALSRQSWKFEIANIVVLQTFKYCEENTPGIIIKNTKGLVIPPVKYNKVPSCIISNPK